MLSNLIHVEQLGVFNVKSRHKINVSNVASL